MVAALTEPVWSDTQNLMFITFGRFAFSVGLAILLLLTLLSPGGTDPSLLACIVSLAFLLGAVGWVNMFLSAWVWHVLSKLVYTVRNTDATPALVMPVSSLVVDLACLVLVQAFLISPMVICVYYSSTGALIYYQVSPL